MGLMLPAILGAKLAKPDMPAVGIGADGSLLMRLGELETFARTGVATPLVIINDQALGTMKSRQKSRGMPEYSLNLHPVDFAGIATACGLRGVTVDTPEQFESELKLAMEGNGTTLIDARVDPQVYQDSFARTVGALA
jgi:thiamine pyrophosphate-dependent acetolactate synthase large subunit-like protein